MSELTLEGLGITRAEVIDHLVERLAEAFMPEESEVTSALREAVLARVNTAIEEIAGRHVLPNVAQYVEALCLQETNRWGEKTGNPVTFTEYLVRRADAYLREEVDYEGKTKEHSRSSFWTSAGTRVSYLIHKHLQYAIEAAMKEALATANSAIVGGIEQAVRIKLGEVAAALRVEVKTR